MGGIYLNAYLPEIAQRKDRSISGYGWSLGYIGGLLALGVSIIFIQPENAYIPFSNYLLNKDTGQHIRIINIFIALWFLIFPIPTFLFVKDTNQYKKNQFFFDW